MREDQAGALTFDDVLAMTLLLVADDACARTWAFPMRVDAGAPLELFPRAWGRPVAGRGWVVTEQTIRRGVRRIMSPAVPGRLPAGVRPATRAALERAYEHRTVDGMLLVEVDQVVQAGLFGEVIY